jgi:hypothetical protein
MFDVEVPGLRQSMAWSLRTMNQTGPLLARDLAQMRQVVQSLADARLRGELDQALRRIQQQIGPMPPSPPERNLAQGTVAAQSAPVSVATATAPPELDPANVPDPSEAYTREVKRALIDAMVESGGSLAVGGAEWLTVAARDNVRIDRFMTGDPSEVTTIVLRIKGGDLAAYRAGRLTLDEVRDRVEAREF